MNGWSYSISSSLHSNGPAYFLEIAMCLNFHRCGKWINLLSSQPRLWDSDVEEVTDSLLQNYMIDHDLNQNRLTDLSIGACASSLEYTT